MNDKANQADENAVAQADNTAEGNAQASTAADATVGADANSTIVSNESATDAAAATNSTDAAADNSGSAELGTKVASAPTFDEETKEAADNLLGEIESFLKIVEAQAFSVGSTLWHLVVHLRDARIHAKDVVAS